MLYDDAVKVLAAVAVEVNAWLMEEFHVHGRDAAEQAERAWAAALTQGLWFDLRSDDVFGADVWWADVSQRFPVPVDLDAMDDQELAWWCAG